MLIVTVGVGGGGCSGKEHFSFWSVLIWHFIGTGLCVFVFVIIFILTYLQVRVSKIDMT